MNAPAPLVASVPASGTLTGTGTFGGARGRATLVMLGLRVAYAYNWFDLGPALPALSAQFGLAPTAWGELVAAFLVGAGLLQVPSGLLARRFGTRATSIVGAALLGVAGIASGLAPSFPALLVLRFLGG
ncbi:MAG TPA: MFS transporter, partial [Thermoplasmata archaeon]